MIIRCQIFPEGVWNSISKALSSGDVYGQSAVAKSCTNKVTANIDLLNIHTRFKGYLTKR